ncbi:50S ribosomal protein L25/general stress protein Ctc [Chelatococcus reniformis]|uniref:Large ribosomal subunit protein bL25 n=1 Tax=Chelatococcus reniformis TaxID=1494448 RepID=A0A916XK52_9HYPH|nr:50S ribosomal protein L25/general stress protein Ctc [Chelatococcus reniformis]GGC80436.1 50S ribosomal protein L25 [Chelatococcus reniformis]
MTAVKQLKAEVRDRVGKGAARAIRRQGLVPAVIYGAGKPAQSIALDFNHTRQLIYAGHFLTTIFEVEVGTEKTRVIPRDFQLDPVRDTPVHVDFLRIGRDATIDVEVPVHFINQDASPGLKQGGSLNVVSHHVGLTVRADSIPEAITVDLKGLEFNDTVHISDVRLPVGAVPTITDRDFTIATIAPPTVAEAAADGAAADAPADAKKA